MDGYKRQSREFPTPWRNPEARQAASPSTPVNRSANVGQYTYRSMINGEESPIRRETKPLDYRDIEASQRQVSNRENEVGGDNRPSEMMRRRKKRPHPKRKWIMGFLFGGMLLGGLLFLAPIPFGSVEIDGDVSMGNELIDNGTIQKPINILQIHRDTLERKLQHDLRVAKVTTSYGFPNVLHIHLEARKPIAVVQTQFGYASLDLNGQCILLTSSLSGDPVPVISGIRLGNVLLGETVKGDDVRIALTFLKDLGNNGRQEISEVNVGNPQDIVAFTTDGLKLKLGNGDKIPEKAKLALQMIKDVRQSKMAVEYIDVNLDSPYVKATK